MRFPDPIDLADAPSLPWDLPRVANEIHQRGLKAAILGVRHGFVGQCMTDRARTFGDAIRTVFPGAAVLQYAMPIELFTPLPNLAPPFLLFLEAPATLKEFTVGDILQRCAARGDCFKSAFPVVITSRDSYSKEGYPLRPISDPGKRAQADFARFGPHHLNIPEYDQVLPGFLTFLRQLRDGGVFGS